MPGSSQRRPARPDHGGEVLSVAPHGPRHGGGGRPRRQEPVGDQGAGVERHPERPVATVEQVFQLAHAIDARYRAMVLVAAFTSLRLGELLALTRRSLDLDDGTITVVAQLQELSKGGHF